MVEGEDLGEKVNDNEEMLELVRVGLFFILYIYILFVMMIVFW